ncbi:NUDIX domain-containing protein [Butyrivibrio sp. INlla16]|uniref:NUDIX domain-containing protein n=1 Tax=Butyrivibrio sp. INlla16 TaxID=1520807 RepID=UPI00087E9BFF|nr:NUDIX domain-containing protein [Butyrivibrio sp. INlla16]SDB56538.1 NUDIX domain-containing protein [Butyrivibrio sp. INlla16]
MEYIEVFTRGGKPTGKTIEKHEKKFSGEYFRHVLIIMKTKDSPAPGKGEGRYVVQQRSLRARYYAGKWDMTGGGVRAGETPKEAAVRELSEELGINVMSDDLELAFDYIKDWDDGTGMLVSIFMIRVEVPESGFDYDHYEVNDVRVMPFSEFYGHIMDHNDEEMGRGIKDIEARL